MSSGNNDAANARAAQIPQFLNKLSAMVDDPVTDKYIKWADDGNSFYVYNPDQFAKELLGTYYKTDASASFVRQLNMYGFHKVPHVRQGALKSDKIAQAWHYENPKFKRGRPDLLPYIARKGKPVGGGNVSPQHNMALQPIKQSDIENDIELLTGPIEDNGALTEGNIGGGEVAPKNIDMSQIINGLATIKRHQTLISDNLKELQSSNQALWQEAKEARERHKKHQETINRILQFLANLFHGNANTPVRSASVGSTSTREVPRPRLMIMGGEEDKDSSVQSPKSTRMEEIMDEESSSFPTGSIKPTEVETPTSALPRGSKLDSVFSPPQANFMSTPPQYPLPDQRHYLSGGTYIPPADAYKILQWLQQNQISIPGVYSPPSNSQTNAGALTTIPPGGNPFAYPQVQTQPMNQVQPNWPTAYGPVAPNQSNLSPALYQHDNQLFNSLLPLANLASDPPPPVTSMAEVGHNSDRINELSNHVEAMQHGIDSLIAGIGLDPLSASNLAQGNDFNLGTNSNQTINTSNNLNPLNEFTSQPLNSDLGSYQAQPFDFDLDALLKQLGAAAATNTPPALHHGDDLPGGMNADANSFTSQLNGNFDPSFMDMFSQTQDPFLHPSSNGTENHPPTGYLNEVTASPIMTRDDSAEPMGMSDVQNPSGKSVSGGGRGRAKKRKNDGAGSSEEVNSGIGRRNSRSAGRTTKRRK